MAELIHIPMRKAYVCLDCESVGNNSLTCPACGSETVWSLRKWIDKTERKPVKHAGCLRLVINGQ